MSHSFMKAFTLLSLIALLLLSLAVPTRAQVNSTAPSVLFHDANTALTLRIYATCAVKSVSLLFTSLHLYSLLIRCFLTFLLSSFSVPFCVDWWVSLHSVHQIATLSAEPSMVALGGATTAYSLLASIDISNVGTWDYGFSDAIVPQFTWAYTGYTGTGCNPVGRVAGGAAYLYNGNLVVAGGKSCPSWVLVNDVIYSSTGGTVFNTANATAHWSARSDFVFAAAPLTNVILLVGGTSASGMMNDVWMSSDGIGAVWQQQNSGVSNMDAFQEGVGSFLFDASTNANGIATFVLYNPLGNNVYQTVNYGESWTQVFSFNTIGLFPNEDARMVADATNNGIFIAGGVGVDGSGTSQILYSGNKGVSFYALNNEDYSPNVSSTSALDAFTYGCLSLRYSPSSTAPNGYHRQLILYSGNITVDTIDYSGYNCVFDVGTQEVTSLLADVISVGEVYSVAVSAPPRNRSPQMVWHGASQELTYRLYADCAYDVHEAVKLTGNTKMWQAGGFTSSYTYYNSIDFTPTGSWLNLQEFVNPTYTGGSPSGRVAGGLAYLTSGSLIYFGGKDSATSVYTNDVYISTNYGASFSLVTPGATVFSPRSDFASAVFPMTNTIVIAGGMYSSTGASSGPTMNDVWISSDGSGATWTQVLANGPFPGFQDAALVALYNSAVINSTLYTQAYPTLLLYTGGYDALFTSTTGGESWTQAQVPWSYRLHGMFIADASNYVYFTGGAASSSVWFSWNSGVSWTNINSPFNGFNQFQNNNNNAFNPSSIFMNIASFLEISSGTGNCMAMRYAANSGSPNGYHKTLVMYGGANTIGVAQRPSPSCVQQVAVNVLYGEVMFAMERRNSSWVDTTMPVIPANTVPTAVFNSPTVLFTYRQYPACAFNVHSLVNHPSSPATYVLGGWDLNNNVLNSYDYLSGSAFSTYSYVITGGGPGGRRNNNNPIGRTAAGAAVLSNGNLLWFGGKSNSGSSSNNFLNDCWYESSPTNGFGQWVMASEMAPWMARSDMTVMPFPGTNCILMSGGEQISGAYFNDVWMSCDGQGRTWTQQLGQAPWSPVQQAAGVALFDGVATGGTQPNATVIYYPAFNQGIYSSTNAGVSWTMIGVAPWSYRTASRMIADAENNLYLVGGENFGSVSGDDSDILGTQALNDVWFSNNKGLNWYQMVTTTNTAYSNPVQPSSFIYSCIGINYTPGNGPQGYHRQVSIASGFQQVYSTRLQLPGLTTFASTNFNFPQCACDEISGVRGVVMDLIFPGESVSPTSSSSSSTSYSAGQTAGIAIGTAIGVGLVVGFLVFCLCTGITIGSKKMIGSSTAGSNRFTDEPSTRESNVEMHGETSSSP